ncbi:MAG: hypothetical protein IPL39_25010 [Opitutaceae bacterium]|nr:hypothetical protein [Opitutaceae bacterium]
MRTRFLFALLAALSVATGLLAQTGTAYATHSFSNRAGWGTHPQTLSYSGGVMTVDLRSIQGANIVRAVFYPHLERHGRAPWPNFDSNAMQSGFNVFDTANNPIPLRGPRFTSVDLTAQVRAAIASGSLSLRLQHCGWSDFALSLSVTCDRPLPAPMPAVTGVSALCRQGDTMVTFAEIEPPLADPNTTWGTFINAFNALDATREVRYRIYRSTSPLTAPADVANAVLVDEIRPLSCWDQLYFGIDEPADSTVVPRYPVADLTLAAPGTGIYVNRFRGTAPTSAYYFVSRMVNGQEDLSTLAVGTNATAAVAESAGPGMVLERARELDAEHYYIEHATKHYYVRWEAPPTCTLPSTPFDYLVAEPPPAARVSPAPVSLALHCWGGSLNGGYLWWYDAMKGALHVSTNQYPYDWWTAYNENLGTLEPIAAGTVQPFTQARVLSFLYDFVDTRFPIDRNKILLHGMSMGGSGASMFGIRSGHIFSGIISMVGVHRPALSPVFVGSFAGVYGDPALACRYDNSILQRFGYPLVTTADNITAWDYWDNDQWLRAHPATETPWITFANGQNDNAIGWPQAWDMAQALIATHRGFNFIWGQGEHGQSPQQLGGFSGGNSTLQFRFNQFVPTAANGSLDGDLGTSPATAALAGQINQYLTWDTATVTDTATRLAFRIALTDAASATTATADITPRRLQTFNPAPGSICNWQAVNSTGQTLASGAATVGADGLFTLAGVVIPKLGNYATVTVTSATPPANYAAWRSASFGAEAGNDAISGPLADPDGAGVTNFARYAFALPARGPVANPITLGTATSASASYLTLTFNRRAVATDLSYIVEASTDLATWTAVPGRTYSAGADPITAQDVVALSTSGTPRRFLRLRITAP